MIGGGPPRGAATRLLVECLLGLGAPRGRIAAVAARGVDWDQLLRVAERHSITEGVHLALELEGVTAPEPVRSRLRDAHELAAARNSVLLAEAARIQAALATEGVDSLLLKGTALLATLPHRIGARHVGDIDLLVPADDLPRAGQIACALGCRRTGPEGLFHDGTPHRASDPHHAPALLTPAGATLELHGRPGHASSTERWTRPLLTRAVTAQAGPWTFRVPAPADQVTILCEHVFDGHRGDRRLRPRHLGDLAMLAAAGAPIDRATALPGADAAIEWSRALVEAAASGLPVARRLFLRPGDPVRSRLATLRATFALAAAHGGPWRVFLPSPAFMSQRYDVSTRAPWFPLLYLWRPARGAWRVIAGR